MRWNKRLDLFYNTYADDTFLQTLVIWESHERNSSSSTPRHLLQLTFFNDMPFIERSSLSVTVAILCLEPVNMYSVLNMFRVSLFCAKPLFEFFDVCVHFMSQSFDTASSKSHVSVTCVHSCRSKIGNVAEIINVYQK